MQEPSTAIDAYKAIIDRIVDEARDSIGVKLLKEGRFTKCPDFQHFNDFVRHLSEDQRMILAQMLNFEREGVIQDVLAELTWWIYTRDVGLTFRGEPMPIDLSGMGLHGDFVGRLQNWEWPDVKTS